MRQLMTQPAMTDLTRANRTETEGVLDWRAFDRTPLQR